MTDLYLVVHERSVINRLDSAPRAGSVLREIGRIKAAGQYVVHDGSSCELPRGLPPPSKDLTVHLVGAYTTLCLDNQYNLLSDKGYHVRFHYPGCLN